MKEKKQLIPKKYKGLYKNSMNIYMPTNQTTWMKWINSQKDNLPKINWEESENLNRHISSNETEAVIKNTQLQKPKTRWLHR